MWGDINFSRRAATSKHHCVHFLQASSNIPIISKNGYQVFVLFLFLIAFFFFFLLLMLSWLNTVVSKSHLTLFCLLNLGEFNLSDLIIMRILFPASQFSAVEL